jgi:lipoprotein-anchoring transpeptidase ErfK/SrfK
MAGTARTRGRHRKARGVPPGGITRTVGAVTGAAARHRGATAAAAAAAAVAAVAAGVLLDSSPAPAPPARHTRPARAVSASLQAGITELATLRVTAPRYASPGQRASGTVPASWYGYPSVLPVIGSTPGWLDVRMAQRPDGSTAWIPAADAALSSTPYQIVVSLAGTRLSLYDHGREVFSAPAGVGSPSDPTPTGQYFIAFTEPPPQPNPGYGPFILVTSDHSQSISDWEGSGDAVIGIHGPLGESLEIGTTGARISHGCIRLQVADQDKLAGMPAGTPVTITG